MLMYNYYVFLKRLEKFDFQVTWKSVVAQLR